MRRGLGVVAWIVAAAALAAPARARAQAVADEPAPSTMTLDRMDATTRAGVQLGLTSVDFIDGFFMRVNPYGQYVTRDRGGGTYGQFPVARFFNGSGPDATATGAVEVGGFLLPHHNSDLLFRLGLAIGTGREGPGLATAHLFSSSERLTDFLLTSPRYSLLRMSMSTVQQWGAVFFRGDFGIDVGIAKPANATAIYLRANAAGGLRTAHADFAVELVNLGAIDAAGSTSNVFFHTAAMGARTRGRHQVHAGAVFPLDGAQRGDVWILSVAYHFAAVSP